ncbi:phosphoglycerate mutase family protein [Shewanella sp. OMA3-2]|uniref:phosphoglycerate mutase family protein n=1 Tax=Shewanella sp. OMA3-2 TaxID=2908650 RepID=UPI001F2E8FE5|nr:phosphoglycerate mutase family protein [Shewanella sp. OMA3-2]UJF20641.1 histidine phosphatase family protein [Shewanella sp. OMA3-2]
MRVTFSAIHQTLICLTLLCLTLFSPLGFTQQETHQTDTQVTENNPLLVPQKWTFILVRHGEKQVGDDPQLNPQGVQRAERLAKMLEHIPLNKVYSTNYQRTQLTAKPTAANHNLPITSYNPDNLEVFSEQLLMHPGNYLIVGHSNTTALLADKLNQTLAHSHQEHSEDFDRLYLIEVNIINGKRFNSMYRFSY